MLHLSDKNFLTNKQVLYSLTNIFGINRWNAYYICQNTGINPTVRINTLNKTQIYKIVNYINQKVEINQDLKNKINDFLKLLHELKTYRGLRNWHGLPVRGQRTKTNSKTKKKLKHKN